MTHGRTLSHAGFFSRLLALTFSLAAFTAAPARAQVPQSISYQGVLAEDDGTPVDDGDYTLTFTLYDDATGGAALWTETLAAAVAGGVFSVVLGEAEPLSALAFDQPYWLGVTVGDDPELAPRIALTAAPYSLTAHTVPDDAITGEKIADGEVVRSLTVTDAAGKQALLATDDVTLAAGAGITLGMVGGSITIAAEGGGTLTLPLTAEIASETDAFAVTQTGSGQAGVFKIENEASTVAALRAETKGDGPALALISGDSTAAPGKVGLRGAMGGYLSTLSVYDYRPEGHAGTFVGHNQANTHPLFVGKNEGLGIGLKFTIMNELNDSAAIWGRTNGLGAGIWGQSDGGGPGGWFLGSPGLWTAGHNGDNALEVLGGVEFWDAAGENVKLRYETSTLDTYDLRVGYNFGTELKYEFTSDHLRLNSSHLQLEDSGVRIQFGGQTAAEINETGGTFNGGTYQYNNSDKWLNNTMFGMTNGSGTPEFYYAPGNSLNTSRDLDWNIGCTLLDLGFESPAKSRVGIRGDYCDGPLYRFAATGLFLALALSGTPLFSLDPNFNPTQNPFYMSVYGPVLFATTLFAIRNALGQDVFRVKPDADPFSEYILSIIGNLTVAGILFAQVKQFQIDHPVDPANRYLYHTSVESPDMKNVYDGVVRLDDEGAAWVDLPGYFEALNRDFRYQLTPIGAPGPNLYVADEVAGNRFRIAGGVPGSKVSWQVTGIRHDPWAEANRTSVEVDKAPHERGYYVNPEVYGRPEARRISNAPPLQAQHDEENDEPREE